MLVLRASLASPFVRKVRIAAALLGLEDRIDIAVADTSDAEDSLRSQNPLGKVPALILENGETIFDSAVIVEYLDWLGGGKIIPSDPKLRFRSLTQESLADGICGCGRASALRDSLARAKNALGEVDRLSKRQDRPRPCRIRAGAAGGDRATSEPSRSPARSAISTCASRAPGEENIRASSPGSTASPKRRRASRRRGFGGELIHNGAKRVYCLATSGLPGASPPHGSSTIGKVSG